MAEGVRWESWWRGGGQLLIRLRFWVLEKEEEDGEQWVLGILEIFRKF